MNKHTLIFLSLLLTILPSPTLHRQAQAQGAARPFTSVTGVNVTPLSNGVQIAIAANGILEYRNALTTGQRMTLLFPDARNATGRNFFLVDRHPVSHIQISTPRDAVGGIGLLMEIFNYTSTSASVTKTPDAQGVLLTIQSNRTIENTTTGNTTSGNTPSTTGAATSTTPAVTENTTNGGNHVRFADNRLSVRVVRFDIHRLMAVISRQTHLPIVVDDAVERLVSVNLESMTPDKAIRSIATAYALAVSQNNGVFMLSEGEASDLATYNLSDTASFRMQNMQAQTASGLLPNFLYSYVKVNPEQNAVVVTAPSQMLAKIGADLKKMDIPPPQILIEAIAVELTDTKDVDLGLRLGSPTNSFSSIDTPAGVITYNSIGTLPRAFEVNLRALELTGKARVRARPRLAVVNGRTANIFIGAQRFIRTEFNSFGQTQTRIQPVDVGVKLLVTPLTGGNGEITTRIAPEVSNITELDLQTGLPVLSTRRADTTVRVKDGETIAIGGLTLSQEQRADGKIPVLGDIPLLGKLFRSKKSNIVQTELVVFITPRILPTSPVESPGEIAK